MLRRVLGLENTDRMDGSGLPPIPRHIRCAPDLEHVLKDFMVSVAFLLIPSQLWLVMLFIGAEEEKSELVDMVAEASEDEEAMAFALTVEYEAQIAIMELLENRLGHGE